ncbi:Uncharacterised protein [Bordetella pertussis]|nr:Uncharacterised protein [Bordetella pertussis]CFN96475.1 Uncharacterised protein [Bordetella pertussis]CFO30166.1 Uncharacterised protein [Bordetella pertussis]CFO35832.1 Uncharacterised protein [Bordetella pertussis]CFO96897.1 Uncharacterised protein [Bordetella pertussis]
MPPIGPVAASVVPAATSKPPLPARVMFRPMAMSAVVASVPPLSRIPAPVAPRFLSEAMETAPPRMCVLP